MGQDLLKDQRKLQPKLRMIADGSTSVNAVRAEFCGAVMVRGAARETPRMRDRAGAMRAVAAAAPELPPPPPLQELPRDVLVSVFVETVDTASERLLAGSPRRGNIVAATLPVDELNDLTARHDVA